MKSLFFWLNCNVVLLFFMVIAFSCMQFTDTQVNIFVKGGVNIEILLV